MNNLDTISKIEERLVFNATLNKIPIGGTFEITPLCNMNCKMCYIKMTSKEVLQSNKRHLSVEEWLKVANDMQKEGTLFVLITGGEPLLYPDFIKLYKGLKDLGMIVTINTNATLITEEIAQLFAKYPPRRVNVTLYGTCNETYEKLCNNPKGFDQTLEGIKLLKKYNVDTKLNGTLVPENSNEIESFINLAKELDIYIKIDTYIYPYARKDKQPFQQNCRLYAKEAAQKSMIIKQIMNRNNYLDYCHHVCSINTDLPNEDDSKLKCRAGKSSFWITWDGRMTPCVFLDNPAMHILENGFKDSWNHIVEHTEKIRMPQSCQQCEKRDVCLVCGACVYTENKHFRDKPDYMCQYMDEIIKIAKGVQHENN